MRVFDFDGTIYRSDSTVDFYLYCVKNHPLLIRYLPRQTYGILKYKFHRSTKEQMKEAFFSFLCGIKDVDCEIDVFVKKNLYKMQSWYMDSGNKEDLVISASPRFLIEKFSEKTTGFAVIATEVDKNTGKFLSRNCYGKEKIRRFREQFPEAAIEEFYSDSDSDMPMAEIAEKAYKVCGEKVCIFKI